jgi:hypothetical protein
MAFSKAIFLQSVKHSAGTIGFDLAVELNNKTFQPKALIFCKEMNYKHACTLQVEFPFSLRFNYVLCDDINT